MSTSKTPSLTSAGASLFERAQKYRGATVEDLDPPSALSCNPSDPISHVLLSAFERDYTHLTVISPSNRALLGYVSIPLLRSLLSPNTISPNETSTTRNEVLKETDPVSKAMIKFRRKGRVYRVITMDTPLEVLDAFFMGDEASEGRQEFAVVTDEGRRFVLGVVTVGDLVEFARRRPV